MIKLEEDLYIDARISGRCPGVHRVRLVNNEQRDRPENSLGLLSWRDEHVREGRLHIFVHLDPFVSCTRYFDPSKEREDATCREVLRQASDTHRAFLVVCFANEELPGGKLAVTAAVSLEWVALLVKILL